MARLLTGLKILGLSLAVLLLLVVTLVGALWLHPALLFGPQVQKLYLSSLAKRGLSSKELRVGARSDSFWEKSFWVAGTDICWKSPLQAAACVEHVDLELAVNLKNFQVERLELRRVHLKAQEITWNLDSATPVGEEKKSEGKDLQAWLDKIFLGDLEIQLGALHLSRDQKKWVEASTQLSNQAQVSVMSQGYVKIFQEEPLEATWKLQGPGLGYVMDLFKLNKAQVLATIGAKKMTFQMRNQKKGTLTFKDSLNELRFPFEVSLLDQALDIRSHRAQYRHKSFRSPFFLENFAARVEWRNRKISDLKQVRAEGIVAVKTASLMNDHSHLNLMPPSLDVGLKLNMDAEDGRKLSGFFEAKGNGEIKKILSVNFDTQYKIDLNEAEHRGYADLKGGVHVSDFKSFAALMNGVGIMVPSPIHIMRGHVRLNLTGTVNVETRALDTEVALSTVLDSEEQNLNLGAVGKLKFKPCVAKEENATLFVDLQTQKVRLKLPNIDYKKPPALLKDARFKSSMEVPTKKGKCKFGYDLKLASAQSLPVELVGPLFKNALPLQFSVRSQNDKDLEGFVRVQNFKTELFRRKTFITRINMDLGSRMVEGRAQVDYTDYKIFMNLSGKVDRIHMELESDPPLPREDLFAILLFGRPLTGLDDDDSGSAANMNAAAKDGALSMASLYLFASTPIESVGYNPHTQGLSAKVRLASGTSLNVGVNEDRMTDVGITRRLAPQWRLRSTVNDPTEVEERSASALVEWFKRF